MSSSRLILVRVLLLRVAILAGGWWALIEGDPSGYAWGIPMVLLALLARGYAPSVPSPSWRALDAIRFAFYFLAQSVVAGFDMARLALTPSPALRPRMVEYPLRLPPGAARNLFMGALSLMPGTLATNIRDGQLGVHVLVHRGDNTLRQLQNLERSISRALGEPLEESHA